MRIPFLLEVVSRPGAYGSGDVASAYVALWTVALIARLGVAYGSTHLFKSDLASFSIQHHIPSKTYATPFVLWVLLMIVIRTIGVIARAQQIGAKIDFSELSHRRPRTILGRVRG